MKTKTITLYQFDELPDALRAKILDKYRYLNVEHSYWYDYDGKTGFSAKEIEEFGLEKFDECDALNYDYRKMTFDLEYTPHVQFHGCRMSNSEFVRTWLGIPSDL